MQRPLLNEEDPDETTGTRKQTRGEGRHLVEHRFCKKRDRIERISVSSSCICNTVRRNVHLFNRDLSVPNRSQIRECHSSDAVRGMPRLGTLAKKAKEDPPVLDLKRFGDEPSADKQTR